MSAGKSVILVIEDERDIRDLLVFNLEREGYATLEAEDGKAGLGLARRQKPDLVLLDVMLPELDGFTVCKELQRYPETMPIPIIMLTARGEDIDRILGLELGADDYVVKPFNVRELLLRVRGLLRRQYAATASGQPIMRHGLLLDPGAHRATWHDTVLELTATEFRLLEDLLRHAGLVRSREDLLSQVWGYEFDGYARTVDTHVKRLRGKLGEAADLIETVRGVGYRCKE